jgi:glycosyltransferase involved in cell wall biosynthesis
MPKISYLISTYNAERFMDARLRNLLTTQMEQDTEVIVVDSRSPQDEKSIVDKWQEMFPDRITYILQDERTPYGVSWLEAWSAAKGEFVCNANTDDMIYPQFSNIIYDAFSAASSDIGFAYTGIHVVDEKQQTLGMGQKQPFDFDLMSWECHTGPAVTWRNDKEFRDKVDWELMTNRAYEYNSAFDYWLFLYFMSLGYQGLAVPDILTMYTQRSDSIENHNKWYNNYQTYSAISEFFPENFPKHLQHAMEFADFENRPDPEEWVKSMENKSPWVRG